MLQIAIGNWGHLAVIISFVTCLIASIAYLNATVQKNASFKQSWSKFGRQLLYMHVFATFAIVFCLYYIIFNNQYKYFYAYEHVSNTLPFYYKISSFWEGQEGSFLLWIFWHAVISLILVHTNKRWEAPLMTIFLSVQLFLASMILGIDVLGIKIGSSPFILLSNVFPNITPEQLPKDGQGLNPLLQNYWMVIHPPTLFLGFALTLIPFAYVLAGIWTKQYKNWIKPALPWTIFAGAILGLGILMGGYWAYETLNFGGYWNWDPVENAVYVPWLLLIASIHLMIVIKNKDKLFLKGAIILVITTFLLIIYATFLTRSGILGSSSVHSFTDLGLTVQLIVFLLFFLVLSIYLTVRVWKEIPGYEKKITILSREFWIFLGVITLFLMSWQVLIPTSFPVFNKIAELLGINSNLAPPADPVKFYGNFQLWFAVLIAILSGVGQFFWWNKIEKEAFWNSIIIPILITLGVAAAVIAWMKVYHIKYIILLTTGIFSLVANLTLLVKFIKTKKLKITGGAIAHIGVALIIIGILFSAGYSKIISLNQSIYSKNFSEDINKKNVLLWRNEPITMNKYTLTYKGRRIDVKGVPGYVETEKIWIDNASQLAIAKKDIIKDKKLYFKKGDTLQIHPENVFYEVNYFDNEKQKEFILHPRIQDNAVFGLVVSPSIQRGLTKDLYTHITVIPEGEREWNKKSNHTLKIGEKFFINDYVASFEKVEKITESNGLPLQENVLAIRATIKLLGKNKDYLIQPEYHIKTNENLVFSNPDIIEDLGLKVSIEHLNPDTEQITFNVSTTQRDYIILKAVEKPLINVLWLGTLLLMIGFSIAIKRRYTEFKRQREKDIKSENF